MRVFMPIYNIPRNVLSTIMFVCILLLAGRAFAGDTGMQKEWYSAKTNPEVWVSIKKSEVIVTVWSNVPATILQKANSNLWKDFDDQYVLIEDFNKDGKTDVGVLEGADVAGGNKCYAVYEYAPAILSFFDIPSMTVCRK